MSRNLNEQQDFEERAFYDYAKKAGIPTDAIERGNDPPDFVLNINNQRIFVELRELMCFNGEHSRNRDKSFRKLIKDAQKKYESLYPDHPTFVEFRGHFNPNLKGKAKAILINQIVSIINEHRPEQIGAKVELMQHELPDQLENISIFSSTNDYETHWMMDEITLYGGIREREFIPQVEEKNNRALQLDLSNYDEVWLFLQTGKKHASFVDLDIPIDKKPDHWVFDKIIMYDRFGDSSGTLYKEHNLAL